LAPEDSISRPDEYAADELSILPQTESIAVCVKEVGK